MTLSVINWNVAENRVWYVRLADTGTEISVGLYLTSADAQAQTNVQANGESNGYGSVLEVTLSNQSGASVPVSLFQDSYAWHLVVSGANGDGSKIFKVKEFVELDEISHSIYRSTDIIEARALAEINAHTHARIIRSLALGVHMPALEPGDIVRLQSSRRSLDVYGQVFEHRITGQPNSLISELEAVSFLALKR
ncbi:conserved hypothetical protein [uncultured Desulfobacterium sp.]|uniref:Uncharacterized protein n=1 Tax=uncultured Desulfobacterium sp. TaxID=201089 RepID=A0A445MSX0_9BACT|nr:conserved hypothetical protein [uncultured Desulfobacterium sp.]